MSATDYTTLIAAVRIEANDTATSNPKMGDTPVGLRDGSNKVFRLAYGNPVADSLKLTYGSSSRSSSGFTLLDSASGYIEMGSAPDSGATQPFFFDYFFQWFTDADYQVMIDRATEDIGGVAGTAVEAGLNSALVQFTLARFWKRRASTYAHLYATAGGNANASPESVTAQFLSLAKAATSEGIRLMNAFYTRYGRRQAPASGTITHKISPYTPRR